jgi:hypothetical protein
VHVTHAFVRACVTCTRVQVVGLRAGRVVPNWSPSGCTYSAAHGTSSPRCSLGRCCRFALTATMNPRLTLGRVISSTPARCTGIRRISPTASVEFHRGSGRDEMAPGNASNIGSASYASIARTCPTSNGKLTPFERVQDKTLAHNILRAAPDLCQRDRGRQLGGEPMPLIPGICGVACGILAGPSQIEHPSWSSGAHARPARLRVARSVGIVVGQSRRYGAAGSACRSCGPWVSA